MDKAKQLFDELDALFHPQSVAVVGVPRGLKTGKLFLIALLDMGFPGPIYPVHPSADEIDGLKAYPSVTAIPGPVDLAIILVQQHLTLTVVKECAAKGVKGAVLFTAGYKETGTEEGRALEDELVKVARSAGMRLFGPNCMGIYSPKSGLSFFPGMSKDPGPVGVISHSGSLTNILGRIAPQQDIRFSKVVSLGNESDLDSADLMAYLGQDPDTGLIACYLENIKDGKRFLGALKAASLTKPVILWKVGLTPEGGQAAASHTGAMAGRREVWEGVVGQSGAVPVVGWEPWVDAIMGFSMLPAGLGDRVAIISGPGGLAVSAAEAVGAMGLRLAELSSETTAALAEFIPPTGTSLRNPIDVSLTGSLEIDIYIRAAHAAAADPGVDTLVVVGAGLDQATNERYTQSLIQVRNEYGKPLLMVNIPGFDPKLAEEFCQSGVPFFQTAERAMVTYAQVLNYQRWRRENSK